MIEGRGGGSERRLSPRDRLFLWALFLFSAACLAIGFWLYPRVNPEASIQFKVDRGSSSAAAERFLDGLGLSARGFRHAARFTYDDEAKTFLERSVGGAAANRIMGGEAHLWRWGHRYFRPLDKEELKVEVATTGEVVGFDHELPEDAPGASLTQDEARPLAEEFLRARVGEDISALTFLESSKEARKNRTDHTFVWKRSRVDWEGGTARLKVRIQGDQPGGFRQWIQIPEGWSRDYENLRSRNFAAGAVASGFLILTMIAAVVVLLTRLRRRDVRFAPATWAGGGVAVLSFLSGLNALPVAFYDYDTTEALSGFLVARITASFATACLWGALVFVVAAAGEPLYRALYPEKISLGSFFTPRGMRTRRFLLSTALGLTLTTFFFAYQEVFYGVAGALGAWAPMEVNYSDLLNTAFPWVFILLIGLQPAAVEEFTSRLFSIPFLTLHTRSRLLALVLPAAIWGFAHSTYPNQPFWIRGAEVGLAGIVIGLVMVRVNIGAVLVWHYTVDALYTSVVLFRSGNTYYLVSAAFAALVILWPLGYAVVQYLRRGGFEEPDGLLNADDPAPPVEERPAGTPVPFTPPSRWTVKGRVAACAVVALGGLVFLLPRGGPGERQEVRLSRDDATRDAALLIRTLGESPDSFRVVTLGRQRAMTSVGRYLLQHGGEEVYWQGLDRYLARFHWRVRFYRPLDAREVVIDIDPSDGSLSAFNRPLAEDDSIPSLDAAGAQALAANFLASHDVDLASLELRDAGVESRPRRLDHTFTWEAREGDPRNVGDALHRVEVVVQGDQIGGYARTLKLPEAWARAREGRSWVWGVRLILLVGLFGGLAGLVLWDVVRGHLAGTTRWTMAMRPAIPIGMLVMATTMNRWPEYLARYPTSITPEVYQVAVIVGVFMSGVVGFLIALLVIAGATALHPGAWALLRREQRAAWLPDALLAALLTLVVAAELDAVEAAVRHLAPSIAPLPPMPALDGARSVVPWLHVVGRGALRTVFWIGAAAAGVHLLRVGRSRGPLTGLILVLACFAAVPLEARGAGEIALQAMLAALGLLSGLAVARFLLRDNALAWVLAAYTLVVGSSVVPWLSAEGSWFRVQGAVAAALFALPAAWLAIDAGRHRREG